MSGINSNQQQQQQAVTDVPEYFKSNNELEQRNTRVLSNDDSIGESPSGKSSTTSTGYGLEMSILPNRSKNYKEARNNETSNNMNINNNDETGSIFTPYGATGKTLANLTDYRDRGGDLQNETDLTVAEQMFDSSHINYERTTTPTNIHDFFLGKDNSGNNSNSNSNSVSDTNVRKFNKHLAQVSQNISPNNEHNRSMSPLTMPSNTAFNHLDFPINTMLDNTYGPTTGATGPTAGTIDNELNTAQLDTVLDSYMPNEMINGADDNDDNSQYGRPRDVNLNLDLGEIDNIRRHSEVSNHNLLPTNNNRASISHQMDFWNMQNNSNKNRANSEFTTLVEPTDITNEDEMYDRNEQKMDKELSQILGDYNLNFIDPFTEQTPSMVNNDMKQMRHGSIGMTNSNGAIIPMSQVSTNESNDNLNDIPLVRKESIIEDPHSKKKLQSQGMNSPQSPRQARQYSISKKQHRYSVPNLHAPLNQMYLPTTNNNTNANNSNNNNINVVPWKTSGSPTSNDSLEMESHQPRRILSADPNISMNFGMNFGTQFGDPSLMNIPNDYTNDSNAYFTNEFLNNNLSTGNINAHMPLQFPTGTSNMYGNSSTAPPPQVTGMTAPYNLSRQNSNSAQYGRSKSTTIANFGRTHKADIAIAKSIGPISRTNINSRRKSRTPSIPNTNTVPGVNFKDNDESDKPFTCTTCGKSFRRSEHLRRHIRSVHSQERPFACTLCDKKFSRSDNLSQHLKTHRKNSKHE
ncbi:similar to Saccharomyces cerevisiae YMR037C MSN2 Transcriptional activator related to Msn4p [Maudiozyma saulgeensis]|uniref:Similar to Saccharomyces cerevisiae YMR037C MSN2 Transcriptional activator related to Msn4p n=1 Tax=Maudiozyma saulgeensis TaxID=1789683 RepID=A0A1X7R821_9SACH|nr:similar to Saccharomyces cerevisiae YMR037C MSN2 Transcriptional activator related to Msn4p [Kazachstania saulgeensis]